MSELWGLETSHAVLLSCPPPELEMLFDPLLGWRSAPGCQRPHSPSSLPWLQSLFQTRSLQVWFSSEIIWAIEQLIWGFVLYKSSVWDLGCSPLLGRGNVCVTISGKDKALQGGPTVRSKSSIHTNSIVLIQLLVSNLIWHLKYWHFAIQNVNILNSRLYLSIKHLKSLYLHHFVHSVAASVSTLLNFHVIQKLLNLSSV